MLDVRIYFRSPWRTFVIFQWILLASLGFTLLSCFILIPRYSDIQEKNSYNCIHHTNMWHMTFLIQANAFDINEISSVNSDVFGLSVRNQWKTKWSNKTLITLWFFSDRLIVRWGWIVIQQSYFVPISIGKKSIQKWWWSGKSSWSLEKTSIMDEKYCFFGRMKKNKLIKGQLDMDLLFQYPERCCGNNQCEEKFTYQIVQRLKQSSTYHLAVQSTDKTNIMLTMHLQTVKSDEQQRWNIFFILSIRDSCNWINHQNSDRCNCSHLPTVNCNSSEN